MGTSPENLAPTGVPICRGIVSLSCHFGAKPHSLWGPNTFTISYLPYLVSKTSISFLRLPHLSVHLYSYYDPSLQFVQLVLLL